MLLTIASTSLRFLGSFLKSPEPGPANWLPPEIWEEISQYLSAPDIFRLGLVSHRLRQVMERKGVWNEAFKRSVVSWGIHPACFPLQQMDIAAIKRTLRAPPRIPRLLHEHSRGWGPVRQGAKPLEVKSQRALDVLIRHHFLVPGGRYLITVGLDNLALWDLGVPGASSNVTLQSITTLTFPDAALCECLAVDQLPNGDLRVVTVVARQGVPHSRHSVTVYRLSLSEAQPAFTNVVGGFLHVLQQSPRMIQRPCVEVIMWGSRLLLRLAPHILVLWDMSKRCYTVHTLLSASIRSILLRFAFTGDMALIFGREQVDIYHLPFPGAHSAAVPRDHSVTLPDAGLNALRPHTTLVYTHPTPIRTETTEIFIPFAWSSPVRSPVSFDVVSVPTYPGSTICIIRQFCLDLTPPQDDLTTSTPPLAATLSIRAIFSQPGRGLLLPKPYEHPPRYPCMARLSRTPMVELPNEETNRWYIVAYNRSIHPNSIPRVLLRKDSASDDMLPLEQSRLDVLASRVPLATLRSAGDGIVRGFSFEILAGRAVYVQERRLGKMPSRLVVDDYV